MVCGITHVSSGGLRWRVLFIIVVAVQELARGDDAVMLLLTTGGSAYLQFGQLHGWMDAGADDVPFGWWLLLRRCGEFWKYSSCRGLSGPAFVVPMLCSP